MRALLVASALLLGTMAFAQSELTVEVVLSKPNAGGVLRVALCRSAIAYEEEQGCISRTVEAKGAVVMVRFDGLAPGSYGIKVYHDINGNEKVDTNWMGIPKEPYGFGNDAMGTFGPPSYEQAAVKVEGKSTARVKLKG
ncbi:MAG: DUF2141 domain-containing protein [Flavobacteriales bacterium]|nr:DUF2141 domain-containing protein [Flavobacteriales bacterium]